MLLMTSVNMIAPLNAANFESGNAPNTHALFSKGDGTSEWREPAGGVPSVEGASDGDVLTVDTGVAVWQAPAGGGGLPLSTLPNLTDLYLNGAGVSLVNGLYTVSGLQGGKSIYTAGVIKISWMIMEEIGYWMVENTSIQDMYYYYSSDDVANPALVTTWEVWEGTPPGPQVTLGAYPAESTLTSDGSGSAVWQVPSLGGVLPYTSYVGKITCSGWNGSLVLTDVYNNTSVGFTIHSYLQGQGQFYISADSLIYSDTNMVVMIQLTHGTPGQLSFLIPKYHTPMTLMLYALTGSTPATGTPATGAWSAFIEVRIYS